MSYPISFDEQGKNEQTKKKKKNEHEKINLFRQCQFKIVIHNCFIHWRQSKVITI